LNKPVGPYGLCHLSLRMRLIPAFLPLLLIGACPWGFTEGVKPSPAPTSQTVSPSAKPAAGQIASVATPRLLTYTVRKGDSLGRIAKTHGLSREQLRKLNQLPLQKSLYPGQKLLLTSGNPSPAKAAVTSSETLPKREAMIRSALSYQGVHYRYGGISSRGLDCSGFVVRVMLNQGVALPHNAAALFGKGVPVSRASLSPGDLVFFHTRGRSLRISHVGIYLGEGNFIHASSGKGRVRIDTLLGGYYQEHFAGARRIISQQQ
jgi:peptidoglycan DL-endopeptidase LytE